MAKPKLKHCSKSPNLCEIKTLMERLARDPVGVRLLLLYEYAVANDFGER